MELTKEQQEFLNKGAEYQRTHKVWVGDSVEELERETKERYILFFKNNSIICVGVEANEEYESDRIVYCTLPFQHWKPIPEKKIIPMTKDDIFEMWNDIVIKSNQSKIIIHIAGIQINSDESEVFRIISSWVKVSYLHDKYTYTKDIKNSHKPDCEWHKFEKEAIE